jgi:sialic acid synthase SpsE
LAILHCVATYPSPMNEMNLRVIPALKGIYPECVVGFSDHSIGLTAAIGAVALGARIVEKHVTLDKNAHGPDHWFSMDMPELKALCDAVSDIDAALGHPRKRVLPCEENGRRLAVRSLSAARDLPAGTVLSAGDLKAVRPGGGLPPKMMEIVHGLKMCRPLRRNEQLSWTHFKDPS